MYANLTFITGTMFGGKTSRLLELYLQVDGGILVTPDIDGRYGYGQVKPHEGVGVPADVILSVENPELLIAKVSLNTREIFIDEVNLFNESLIPVIDTLLRNGYSVICSGLLKDFRNVDFPVSRILYDLAYKREEWNAKCSIVDCSKTARYNQRLRDGQPVKVTDPVIMVGGSESYEPRCAEHFQLLQ